MILLLFENFTNFVSLYLLACRNILRITIFPEKTPSDREIIVLHYTSNRNEIARSSQFIMFKN